MTGDDVVLVRHGETEWIAAGRHTGRSDVPLTPLGRRQAAAVGARLAGERFARVLSSPLGRARETMRLAGLGGAGELCDHLREWDYGVYEGSRTVDVRTRLPGWSVWTHPVVDGESVAAVGERADRVVDAVLAAAGPIVVFSHGRLLRVLAARWIGLPAAAGRLLAFDTATVSVLGRERETRVVRLWNEACRPGTVA